MRGVYRRGTPRTGLRVAYASEFSMDIATGLGLLAGIIVLCTLILMGGDFRMFYDIHAVIIIFGGSFAATLIRFPLYTILHGLPLGAKFAFTLRRTTARDLVDEEGAELLKDANILVDEDLKPYTTWDVSLEDLRGLRRCESMQ